MTTAENVPHLDRSTFGGLLIDRSDSESITSLKAREGTIAPDEVEPLRHFIEHGYVVFRSAVDSDLIDEFLAFFEQAGTSPPPGIYAHSGGKAHPLSEKLYDRIATDTLMPR